MLFSKLDHFRAKKINVSNCKIVVWDWLQEILSNNHKTSQTLLETFYFVFIEWQLFSLFKLTILLILLLQASLQLDDGIHQLSDGGLGHLVPELDQHPGPASHRKEFLLFGGRGPGVSLAKLLPPSSLTLRTII
jgi:hypothetical protein